MSEDRPPSGKQRDAPLRRRKSKPSAKSANEPNDVPGSTPSSWFIFTSPMTAGGSVSDVTRDQIRRQAAHASSAQRVSTIQRMKASKAKENARALQPTDQIDASTGSQHHVEDGRTPLRRSVSAHSRRSSINPSPTESYSLSRPRTPFSAPSSPQEVVGAGRIDPFLSYPTENKHPIIPSLVDHFLTYFAPAPSSTSYLHGRDQMRLELWPEILRSSCMFDAVMLFTGTHLSICRGMDPNAQKQQALWLRQNALASINKSISGSTLSTLAHDNIAAVAMELEFGERAHFDIHMRILQEVVAKLDSGIASLPPAIQTVLLTAGNHLPAFASSTIYFNDNREHVPQTDLYPKRLSTDSSSGLTSLREKCLPQRGICQLVTRLLVPVDDDEDSRAHLRSVYHQLLKWDPYEVTSRPYCFLQTQMEDDINAHCHLHFVSAGLALCSAIACDLIKPGQEYNSFDFGEAHCSRLESEMLLKTVCEEPTAWALFNICAALMHQPSKAGGSSRDEPRDFYHISLPTLKKFLHKLEDVDIMDWPAFELFLSRYGYPSHLSSFRSRCYSLWAQILNRPSRRSSIGNVSSTTSASSVGSSASSPSSWNGLSIRIKSSGRYQQGVQHPTVVKLE